MVYCKMKAILLLTISIIILSQSYGLVYADHGGSSHANINVLEGTNIIEQPITVTTDSASYETGEMINVSGSVADYDVSDPMVQPVITLTLLDPKSNIISISQLPLNDDGSYSTLILAQGPLWKFDGEYTISVNHGSDKNTSITFTFVESTTVADEETDAAAEAEAAAAEAEAAAAEAEAAAAEKCGEGTHLEDGVCVLDETSQSSTVSTGSSPSTGFNSWIYSISFTILIAFAIMIILYLISRASKNKNDN